MAPGPDPLWVWIWVAWRSLSADRPWVAGGMGPSQPRPITAEARRVWAAEHGYDEDDTAVFEAGVAAMDDVYLAWHQEEVERAAEAAKAGRKRG